MDGDSTSINDRNSDGVPSPLLSPIEPDYSSLSSSSTCKGLVGCKSEPTMDTMSPNPTMDSRIASITAGTTTFATVETILLPVVESEKRTRKRRVSEGHNTTPAAKATKKTETPVNNERLERRKKASATSSSSATARPACSYTTMIMEVFQTSNKVKLDLPDIYSGIMAKYPFYRKAGKVWQSSVRHALSQSKFFGKLERRKDEPGKGSLWIIDSQNKQTPNPSRKRKASGVSLDGGDLVSASTYPITLSKEVAPPKLACTSTGESLEDEFHSSVASIPSPAASDDADDPNTVRRSGRARRPPRTKEADDYITPATHSRKPSLVCGVSLSTPPSSPAPQDHHHSEMMARMTSPPSPSSSSLTRKRSSSIRSDKSLTDSVVPRMNHFTIDLPLYNPAMSAHATPAITTGTLPRRAPMNLDLASVPGVVTSSRIRRPPQKLAEFVSSEDFKAAPCGKRSSLVSAASSSLLPSANQDRAAASVPTTTPTPAGAGAGAGAASQRIERRGRKRARPNVESQSSILEQQQNSGGDSFTTVGRRSRRAMTFGDGSKGLVGSVHQQGVSSLPAAVSTVQSPVSASGCAPAFISLKDLELSHAVSLEEEYDDDYDDDYDNDDDDQFPTGSRSSSRSGTRGVSSRRHGGSKPCQNDTYEQRRLAGIQQIVVASLDWYEESDSESEDEDVDIEGDSDVDMGAKNDTVTVVGSGGTVARSGCDSGFDSESDSCKGFVRETGWVMTTEATRLGDELDIDGTTTSSQEAFETVCITPPEEALAAGSSLAEDVLASGMVVESDFLDHAGAGLAADQVEVGSQSCVDPSSIGVDTSSLLPTITGIVTSPFEAQPGAHDDVVNRIEGTESIKSEQEALSWPTVPMIAGGILEELVAVTAAVTLSANKMSVSGVEGIEGGPMEVDLEEHNGGDATVYIGAAAAVATTSEATELKADNYMGWLNL
ncbi:Forkhead box protein K1 [Linnemannia gamsii]|uniref:Forkhead box protein K1 n=1 Tax=Linnemannia gamsii TaxID=64522 RepID=A0ABQ7K262_9FUNG|nr:Forkhead box protein K1 [Linnemannia gamsii]